MIRNRCFQTVKRSLIPVLSALAMLSVTACSQTSSVPIMNYSGEGGGKPSDFREMKLTDLVGYVSPEDVAEEIPAGPVIPGNIPAPIVYTEPLGNAFGAVEEVGENGYGIVLQLTGDSRDYTDEFLGQDFPEVTMGGLTRFWTAYVAVRNVEDLSEKVTFDPEALEGLENCKLAKLKEGDSLTYEQLLYGMFVCSGCDAANMLAIATAGSVEEFVDMMNETAEEFGFTHTTFVNATGLDQEGATTNLYEAGRMVSVAMSRDVIVDAAGTGYYLALYEDAEGEEVEKEWISSNVYLNKQFDLPEDYSFLTAMSSSTAGSGHCDAFYFMTDHRNRYVAMVVGTKTEKETTDTLHKLAETAR